MSAEQDDRQGQVGAVVREVNRALVGAETQADLETAVCEAFARSSPYVFAWIGSHDPATERVAPRTAAGGSRSYLDVVEISTAEDAPPGPTARAVETGDVHVMQDVRNDPTYEPWREQALEHGFESSAAIPIRDDGDDYGVLSVYADRPNAFDARERRLLSELGATIATAVAGIEARRELEAQKEQYERFTKRISDAYYAIDADWRVTFWNDQMAERTGHSADEVLGETLLELFPSLEGTELERRFRHAMDAAEPDSFEYRFEEPLDYWVEIDLYPDEEGLSVFSREITERKEREQERAATNTVLRTIVESLPSGILVEDADRDILTSNEQLCNVLDVDDPCEALVGRNCAEAAAELADRFADPEGFLAGIEERIDDREPVRNETLRLADGRVLERDYVPYELPDGAGNLWLYRDVTARHDRERDLERSRRIIENSTDVSTIVDPDGEIEYVSPAVERVLGYDPDDLVGEDGFAFQPPETQRAVADAIDRVVADPSRTETVQTRFRRADGSWCWVESTLRNHVDDDRIGGILVSSREITERKEYEKRLEEQRDNLQTLNQMVRHDIRNDLQLVTAYADLLAERLEDGEEREYVDVVREQAAHATELTRTAADMAAVMVREDAGDERVSLAPALRGEVEDAREAHPDAAVTIDGDIPVVDVRANRLLESVFRNLIQNAVQHHDGDAPTVTVSAEARADTVRVRVADDGPGVPDSQKEDVFGRGERGLDSEGTGLGLHLVQTVVSRYGGSVWVEDADPQGAVFVVELQQAD
jgi:PAS domain S-box-containing protein